MSRSARRRVRQQAARKRMPRGLRPEGLGPSSPTIERLEDRLVMSLISWDGGGGDADWNNRFNWDTDVLPGAADDVSIGTGSPEAATISLTTGSVTINSLHSGKSLSLSGGSLSIA